MNHVKWRLTGKRARLGWLNPIGFAKLQRIGFTRVLGIMALGLLCGLVFFYRLGSTGLVDETEPLFVEAARQMYETGDWITPYFNGVTRFDKPPLIYWGMAIGFHLLGVNEWAARLPSAISGTLLTVFCCYTVRQAVPKSSWVAYLVAAIGALNLMTLFFGRLGYSDMLLSLCFGGSLLAFFLGYCREPGRPKTLWYGLFYVLMALAVLTKGPVGVVLPSTIVVIFLLWVGKLRSELRQMQVLPGTILFLLISVPWYVLVYLKNGDAFIQSFFGMHNVERFTSVVNQHQGPWYFHWVIVLIGFAPWSLALPAAIGSVFRQRLWQKNNRKEHLGLFALVWFGVILGFFTIAVTKYITYSLPLFPAAAILVGLWHGQNMAKPRSALDLKITAVISLVFAVALGICAWYCPQWLNNDPSMPNLGQQLQATGLPIWGAVVCAMATIAGVGLMLWRRLQWHWSIQVVGWVAFLLLFIIPGITIIDAERQLPLRQIAQDITQVRKLDEPIVMVTQSFEKPSLVFYTQELITFQNRAQKLQPYLEILQQQGKVASLLLVTTPKTLQEAKVSTQQYQLLQQHSSYQLLRISMNHHSNG